MPRPKDQICQPIEAFKKGCFSASGRTEDGEYLPREDVEVNIPQSLKGLIIETKILDDNLVF